LDKEKNLTNTYNHLYVNIAPFAKISDKHSSSIQKWLDNVDAIQHIATDLNDLDPWKDSWDYFDEKLKHCSKLNFFKWIKAFQSDVEKNDKPYIVNVIKYLLQTTEITRDSYSTCGWLVKLPVWDQLRNTFMKAVIEAHKDSDELSVIKNKIVELITTWLHPTNYHKHAISDDGTVTDKTAKRMKKIISQHNLDNITGMFCTLDDIKESGLALNFSKSIESSKSSKVNGSNGLLTALELMQKNKVDESNGSNGSQTVKAWSKINSIGKTFSQYNKLKSEMTLQEFYDAITILNNDNQIANVSVDVSNNHPPAIIAKITSGKEHEKFFKNPMLLSSCHPNVTRKEQILSYYDMAKLVKNNSLPVIGMCTNNEFNLHFIVDGAIPQIKYGIPSWRDHIKSEWYQEIDQSKVADFINRNTELIKPSSGKIACGLLETRNHKTNAFYHNPKLYITYKDGSKIQVILTAGKGTDKVWNKPSQIPQIPQIPQHTCSHDDDNCDGGGGGGGSK